MPAELDVELLSIQAQLCQALQEAPRSQAIGAACAFLLHCRDVDRAQLRRVLRTDAEKNGVHRSILRLLQDA